jgi:hypothetical protein
MTPTHFQNDELDGPLRSLRENGFCVISRLVPASKMPELSAAYDKAVVNSSAEDTHKGRSSTRANIMIDSEPVFASLCKGYTLHAAARQVIGGPFKLSCFHARSLHAPCEMGEFHIDFRDNEQPFPLLSFIYMIDEFSEATGATRFVAGSQHHARRPNPAQQEAYVSKSVSACGPAGSVIIFDGRVWHGHGANSTSRERRSLQGSFIPAAETAATEFDIPIFDLIGT